MQSADIFRLQQWNMFKLICSKSRSVALNNCSVQRASRLLNNALLCIKIGQADRSYELERYEMLSNLTMIRGTASKHCFGAVFVLKYVATA